MPEMHIKHGNDYMVITLTMVVMGLPAGTLIRYVGEPSTKMGMEIKIVAVDIPKPHCQPKLSSIHTTKVTAMRAPQESENTK